MSASVPANIYSFYIRCHSQTMDIQNALLYKKLHELEHSVQQLQAKSGDNDIKNVSKFTEYGQATTLHGLNHITNKERNIGIRILWILIFVGCMTGVIFFSVSCCSKYFAFDTRFSKVLVIIQLKNISAKLETDKIY